MSGYTEIALLQYEIKKLRAERSALRAELREICTALDDAACDLVPTAVECIKKLKAENEWQPIETNGATNELENHMCNCEWRDIETAPKNIEIFIGSFIDEVFVFGKAVCFYEVGNEFEGEFYRGWFWSIDDVCESVAECPTHWMPLPKPPAMAQGEQG